MRDTEAWPPSTGVCEYIARDHKAKIAGGVDTQIQICVHGNVGRNPVEREFTRTRDVCAGRYGGVVVDIRQRPTRLLRRGRQASKETGDPEAHAAFIGQRMMGKKSDRGRQGNCSDAKSASMCRDWPPAFRGDWCNPRYHVVPPRVCRPRTQPGRHRNPGASGAHHLIFNQD